MYLVRGPDRAAVKALPPGGATLATTTNLTIQMITKRQKSYLGSLLRKHGLWEERAAYLSEQLGRGCSGTSDLSFEEGHQMIKALIVAGGSTPPPNKATPMRRKILARAAEIGWVLERADGKLYADRARIDEWCRKYSYLHKPLGDYAPRELPRLVSQFCKMVEETHQRRSQAPAK